MMGNGDGSFELIETMRWAGGVRLLGFHLDRLKRSAGALGFVFDPAAVEAAIQKALRETTAALPPKRPHRLRLLAGADGPVSCTATPLDPPPTQPLKVCIAQTVALDASDPLTIHKTTRRALYDAAWAEARSAGCDEALLLDTEGRVCEGSRSNLFATIHGQLVTPPASLGILPGVYRRYLLKKHPAIVERHLTPADLVTADAIYLTNAVWEVRLAISE